MGGHRWCRHRCSATGRGPRAKRAKTGCWWQGTSYTVPPRVTARSGASRAAIAAPSSSVSSRYLYQFGHDPAGTATGRTRGSPAKARS